MKKLFMLFFLNCSVYSLFASVPINLTHLVVRSLFEAVDISELEKYKNDNRAPINLHEHMFGKSNSLARFLETKVNPELFPLRSRILKILDPIEPIADFQNPENKTLDQQVADLLERYMTYPDSDLYFNMAKYAFTMHPIWLNKFKYSKDMSLDEAFKFLLSSARKEEICTVFEREQDKRFFREYIFACLATEDTTAFDNLDRYIATHGISNREYILDEWEKVGGDSQAFAKELKLFLRDCFQLFPNGERVVNRLSNDATLLDKKLVKAPEPNALAQWFAKKEYWFDEKTRSTLHSSAQNYSAATRPIPKKEPNNHIEPSKEKIDGSKAQPVSLWKKIALGGAIIAIGYALYKYRTPVKNKVNNKVI